MVFHAVELVGCGYYIVHVDVAGVGAFPDGGQGFSGGLFAWGFVVVVVVLVVLVVVVVVLVAIAVVARWRGELRHLGEIGLAVGFRETNCCCCCCLSNVTR